MRIETIDATIGSFGTQPPTALMTLRANKEWGTDDSDQGWFLVIRFFGASKFKICPLNWA